MKPSITDLDDLEIFNLDQRQQNRFAVTGMVGSAAFGIPIGIFAAGGAGLGSQALALALPATFAGSALLHSNPFVKALALLPVALFVGPVIRKARFQARQASPTTLKWIGFQSGARTPFMQIGESKIRITVSGRQGAWNISTEGVPAGITQPTKKAFRSTGDAQIAAQRWFEKTLLPALS